MAFHVFSFTSNDCRIAGVSAPQRIVGTRSPVATKRIGSRSGSSPDTGPLFHTRGARSSGERTMQFASSTALPVPLPYATARGVFAAAPVAQRIEFATNEHVRELSTPPSTTSGRGVDPENVQLKHDTHLRASVVSSECFEPRTAREAYVAHVPGAVTDTSLSKNVQLTNCERPRDTTGATNTSSDVASAVTSNLFEKTEEFSSVNVYALAPPTSEQRFGFGADDLIMLRSIVQPFSL